MTPEIDDEAQIERRDTAPAREAFVTGGSGFAGGHLCHALRAQGWGVRALVRPTSDRDAVARLERIGCRIVRGDLRDPAGWRDALRGSDVVFHLAAAFREARLSDAEYRAVNVGGTVALVEAAADARVSRFVHCSTVGVHGDTGRTPANEQTPFAPPDSYCESKLEGELAARERFVARDLPGVVFRPVGLHGPGDTRFLKLFRGLARGRFVRIGDGDVLYHMTYIDDLCDGILRCATKPEAVGEAFILGGDRATTLNELFAAIARAVGGRVPRWHVPLAPVLAAGWAIETLCRPLRIEPPLHRRRVEFFSKHRSFEITKARRLLGFAPQVGLHEGIERTARAYREAGWL